MSKSHISAKLRQQVAEKSRYLCCYCQSQQRLIGILLTVEHIIPESLGGSSTLNNLCLACWDCNLIKGNRIAAIDPQTGTTVRLFNPNKQNWNEHFCWHSDKIHIIGITPIGRATVVALKLNLQNISHGTTRKARNISVFSVSFRGKKAFVMFVPN